MSLPLSDPYTNLEPDIAAELEGLSGTPRPAPTRQHISPWPTLADNALYGLPGEIVRQIDPYTEADPVSTLMHLMIGVGNMIGDAAHMQIQSDRHPARLFGVAIGQTSKGRKGTSWSAPRDLLAACDPEWAARRVRSGLSSGEGLIFHTRDAADKDEGEPDKRLLIVEQEFSSMLRVMSRDGNSLSGVLRQAWDGSVLSTLTRNNPLIASGAHLSLIGHTCTAELLRNLDSTERANGFGNRILWFVVKRSKLLPDGAEVPAALMTRLSDRLKVVMDFGRRGGRYARTPDAAEIWRRVYPTLSEGRPGLSGALLNRAESQTARLSLAYALMDCSPVIRIEHLKAALALWSYCEASVYHVFGDATGDPVADQILSALQDRDEMTREEIRTLFSRHRDAAKDQALDMLLKIGRICAESKQTGGRPATIYRLAL